MFRKKWKNERKNIALFVDGPNIIRKEFSIDLDDIRKSVEEHGRVMIAKIFLNQYAPEKLVEAISNQGFEPVVILAGEQESDVDVAVAVNVVKAAFNNEVDTVAIASRDADFLPAVQAVKERGKQVIVLGMNPGFSKALQRAADIVKLIPKKERKEKGKGEKTYSKSLIPSSSA